MKDIQFASLLKKLSIVILLVGVIGFVLSFFTTLISGIPNTFDFLSIIASGVFCYALSIIVHAAALYIKNNTSSDEKKDI